MRLIWHTVRKDLYRLRWILLLWVVVTLAHFTLAELQANLDAERGVVFLWAAVVFGALFLPALAGGLVMGVQADDPVCDSDAFWITRPISAGRLLSAKLLVLALFCLVPVAMNVPWWLYHGFDPGQFVRAAGQTIETQLVLTALVLPCAVLAPTSARFLLNATIASALVAAVAISYALRDPQWQAKITPAIAATRAVLLVVLWLAAVGTVVVLQYRGRRTRQSVLVVIAAGLLGAAVLHGWTWNLLPVPAASSLPAGPGANGDEAFEMPLRTALRLTRHGTTVRIVEVVTNDPSGALIVALSESIPEPARQPWPWVAPDTGTGSNPGVYTVTGRRDGRILLATVSRARDELSAGKIRYFRTVLVFSPVTPGNRDFPANLHDWVMEATLRKATAK